MAASKMSRTVWTSIVSGSALAGVLYPTISIADQVSTSAASLQTVQISRTNQISQVEQAFSHIGRELNVERSQRPEPEVTVAQIAGKSLPKEFSTRPDIDIQQFKAAPEVLSQQPPQPAAPSTPAQPGVAPTPEQIQQIQKRLKQTVELAEETEEFNPFQGSPALSVANPIGFGADDNTVFVSGTFQERTRLGDEADGTLGFGVGLLDSREIVGLELSYTIASFGGSRDFGAGGFNAKVHRQFPEQDLAVAVGVTSFLTIGDDNDFEDAVYGVVTKVLRTRESLDQPFSRVALTAGVGNGRFISEDDVFTEDKSVRPFGSVALRVARPVSAIAEWTGDDLAAGVSLGLTPFPGFNLVITPAVRDIAGTDVDPRFVLGVGFSFDF